MDMDVWIMDLRYGYGDMEIWRYGYTEIIMDMDGQTDRKKSRKKTTDFC